ncbi:DUF4326 domain-containing protein [Streptomyces sp. DH12]|uniref:DUF4326 domain-containing protein n=1 Tax=Streptomyces sp. DH12 TaxID=2857010 RepID=UPI001E4C446D|nr:DUF4326 domain-containing protein [Streptomyces sp. DH12]
MAARIQRRRTKGWRAANHTTNPLGAVYVGRGSRWGNPAALGLWVSSGPTWRDGQRCTTSKFVATREEATMFFRLGMRHGGLVVEGTDGVRRPVALPPAAEIRRELAGRDLLCWCPLDQPCHADVLLDLANAPR